MNVDTSLTGPDIEVNFCVFVRTSADEHTTYAGRRSLCKDLGSIMDLVNTQAAEMAGEILGMNVDSQDSFTRVYEVRFPNNLLRWMSLTTTVWSASHRGDPAGFEIQEAEVALREPPRWDYSGWRLAHF